MEPGLGAYGAAFLFCDLGVLCCLVFHGFALSRLEVFSCRCAAADGFVGVGCLVASRILRCFFLARGAPFPPRTGHANLWLTRNDVLVKPESKPQV